MVLWCDRGSVRDRVRPRTHDKRSANAFGHFQSAFADTYAPTVHLSGNAVLSSYPVCQVPYLHYKKMRLQPVLYGHANLKGKDPSHRKNKKHALVGGMSRRGETGVKAACGRPASLLRWLMIICLACWSSDAAWPQPCLDLHNLTFLPSGQNPHLHISRGPMRTVAQMTASVGKQQNPHLMPCRHPPNTLSKYTAAPRAVVLAFPSAGSSSSIRLGAVLMMEGADREWANGYCQTVKVCFNSFDVMANASCCPAYCAH